MRTEELYEMGVECVCVDKLPDVINKVFLVPKEVESKKHFGETVTVYEEWMFRREKLGEINPRDDVDVLAVLEILHECITAPEVDESDQAMVDYRKAVKKILELSERNE